MKQRSLDRRKRKETRHDGYFLSIGDMAGLRSLATDETQSFCLSGQFQFKTQSHCRRHNQAVIRRNKESTLETLLLGPGHGNDQVHPDLSSLLAA
jgi:hypothetical protein